jgi:hypothetical protein
MALIICRECGKEYSDRADKCPNCACPTTEKPNNQVDATHKGLWANGKLAIGIISILLSVLSVIQLYALWKSNTYGWNVNISRIAGFGFAIWMMVAGIVGICTRSSRGRAGAIITCILYYIAFSFTYGYSGGLADLKAYGYASLAFGIVFLVSVVITKRPYTKASKPNKDSDIQFEKCEFKSDFKL